MASDVQICNMAIGMMGGGRIATIDDASAEGRACKTVFSLLRDEVQESHAWTFARKRASLARLDETPAFGYLYAYALPSDCLRVLKMDGDEYEIVDQSTTQEIVIDSYGKKWEIEAGKLLTDEEEVKILYIARVEDPAKFPPSFVQAFSARMAVALAMSVAKNFKLADALNAIFERRMARAKSLDADTDRTKPYQSTSYVGERL